MFLNDIDFKETQKLTDELNAFGIGGEDAKPKLIFKGFRRGALVQFDRGSIKRLEEFIAENPQTFSDMHSMLEELKISEKLYRASLVDITHHHFRLLYSPKLWSNIFSSLITGWKVRALIDDRSEQHLRKNFIKTLIFAFLGIIPFIGRFFRRIWGQPYYRKHYRKMLCRIDCRPRERFRLTLGS